MPIPACSIGPSGLFALVCSDGALGSSVSIRGCPANQNDAVVLLPDVVRATGMEWAPAPIALLFVGSAATHPDRGASPGRCGRVTAVWPPDAARPGNAPGVAWQMDIPALPSGVTAIAAVPAAAGSPSATKVHWLMVASPADGLAAFALEVGTLRPVGPLLSLCNSSVVGLRWLTPLVNGATDSRARFVGLNRAASHSVLVSVDAPGQAIVARRHLLDATSRDGATVIGTIPRPGGIAVLVASPVDPSPEEALGGAPDEPSNDGALTALKLPLGGVLRHPAAYQLPAAGDERLPDGWGAAVALPSLNGVVHATRAFAQPTADEDTVVGSKPWSADRLVSRSALALTRVVRRQRIGLLHIAVDDADQLSCMPDMGADMECEGVAAWTWVAPQLAVFSGTAMHDGTAAPLAVLARWGAGSAGVDVAILRQTVTCVAGRYRTTFVQSTVPWNRIERGGVVAGNAGKMLAACMPDRGSEIFLCVSAKSSSKLNADDGGTRRTEGAFMFLDTAQPIDPRDTRVVRVQLNLGSNETAPIVAATVRSPDGTATTSLQEQNDNLLLSLPLAPLENVLERLLSRHMTALRAHVDSRLNRLESAIDQLARNQRPYASNAA